MTAGRDRRKAVRPGECPVGGAGSAAADGAARGVPGDIDGGREGDARGHAMARLSTFETVRALLRERGATTQAGFTAEAIPTRFLKHHPILLSDGPQHDEQRRKAGRFFSPTHVDARYTRTMQDSADRLVADAVSRGGCDLDQLALHYSVEVTREAIGLTRSPLAAMSRRLERFMDQPPFDLSLPGWGRSRWQWAKAAGSALGPLLAFHLRDVRPAIAEHRRAPREDLLSHLLAEGYTESDILVECVTYATAGMITTREFIVMACWHLLEDASLRSRFQTGGREERAAILHEIIRLEPPVGHLYRRMQEDWDVPPGGGCPVSGHGKTERARGGDGGSAAAGEAAEASTCTALLSGELVDLDVRAANGDPAAVGEDPLDLRPGRDVPRGVGPAGLSFGAGVHKCPGQHLAIAETDVLLQRLLDAGVELVQEPEIGWEDLVAGYTLRGATVRFTG